MLEVDKGKRRIRLGMKQLVPTSLDEYIAEHKEGDVVTGRVVDVSRGRARVELGEGVTGYCAVPEGANSGGQEANSAADLSALTSLLAARWKGGGAAEGKDEPLRAGQIRTFRISKLNAESKRIDLEVA